MVEKSELVKALRHLIDDERAEMKIDIDKLPDNHLLRCHPELRLYRTWSCMDRGLFSHNWAMTLNNVKFNGS
jgi:hypothetical protein